MAREMEHSIHAIKEVVICQTAKDIFNRNEIRNVKK